MDKLARRTRMAERQVNRRASRMRTLKFRQELYELRSNQSAVRREVVGQLRAAIRARREDWEMGPLAPRRTIGDSHWGTISPRRAQQSTPLPPFQIDALCAWAGGKKHFCLVQGDRVAVIEGWQKGKIDVVTSIDLEAGTVVLESATRTNVDIPPYMLPAEAGDIRIQAMPTTIPLSAVRLVHPLRDEETGVTRDVVIQKLKPTRISYDRPTRKLSWIRVVPGLNVEIPWPKTDEPEKKDYDCDTLRIDVEEKTFVPTLLRPPVPESVINELRNQYSKFRTRHTEEYIAEKEAEEALKQARKDSVETMITPLQELNRQQRDARRARGQPELTDEMLERIGEVMARNHKRTLRAIGVSDIERGMGSLSTGDASTETTTSPNS